MAIGTARAALDEYGAIISTRRVVVAGLPLRSEWTEYQHHYGQAASLIETAEAALMETGRRYMEYARLHGEGGDPFTDEKDARLLIVEQQCTNLAAQAVDIMFRTGGTSATKSGERMQRYFRDISVIRTHMANQCDRTWANYTRVVFGLPTIGVM